MRRLFVAVVVSAWLIAGQDAVSAVRQMLLLGAGPLSVTAQATTWGSITGTLSSQTDLQTALNGKLGTTGNGSGLTNLTKAQVGLGNADNTSDANKPISTATQAALDGKQASGSYATGSGTANGTNTGDQTITLTGNVTGSGTGSFATTIANSAVTLAKLADIATGSLYYRKTAGNGAPEVNTLATLKTDLALVKGDVGLGNADNTADSAKSVSSAATLTTPRTINGVSFNGSANITVTAAGSTLSDNVPFARGGIGASAATSATTGTMTVNMTAPVITITPTGAATFNASGGVAGQIVTFSITTSGTSSFVLTWGTNFRKTGTLATGTVSARFFTVTFRCLDGTVWTEIGRTAVQS